MIIRNLTSKTKIPSTPLGVTRQAERSRDHIALKTGYLILKNNTCKKPDIQFSLLYH
jgi:hypothetical protein